MTSTGKAARKRYGTRANAKRTKSRKGRKRTFGHLPVSESRGNAEPYRTGRA